MFPVILTGTAPTSTIFEATSTAIYQIVNTTTPQGSVGGLVSATTTISGAIERINHWFVNLNWANPSWDLFILFFFILGAFLYGISLGRDRIIVMLFAIYIAYAIVLTTPLAKFGLIQSGVPAQGKLLVFFFIAFAVGMIILSRLVIARALASSTSGAHWLHMLILSVVHVGLMVSIVLSLLPGEIVSRFSEPTIRFFASPTARFFWIVAPLIGLAFVRHENKK